VVALFGRVRVVTVDQLQNLAARDRISGVGQNFHYPHALHFDHHFESARVQEIADQYAGLVSPNCIRRRLAAPHGRAVHHVVVQERGGMDKLNNGGELNMGVAAVPERSGPQNHDHRTKAFATAIDDIGGQLVDQGHVGPQAGGNLPINRLHIVVCERLDGRKIHGRVLSVGGVKPLRIVGRVPHGCQANS